MGDVSKYDNRSYRVSSFLLYSLSSNKTSFSSKILTVFRATIDGKLALYHLLHWTLDHFRFFDLLLTAVISQLLLVISVPLWKRLQMYVINALSICACFDMIPHATLAWNTQSTRSVIKFISAIGWSYVQVCVVLISPQTFECDITSEVWVKASMCSA